MVCGTCLEIWSKPLSNTGWLDPTKTIFWPKIMKICWPIRAYETQLLQKAFPWARPIGGLDYCQGIELHKPETGELIKYRKAPNSITPQRPGQSQQRHRDNMHLGCCFNYILTSASAKTLTPARANQRRAGSDFVMFFGYWLQYVWIARLIHDLPPTVS